MALQTSGDLTLVGISKEFETFTAVHPLDLKVPAGSFFALLGPSGCGKTTTLRMVAGLEEPTTGKILIGDQDITDTKAFRRNVNTVFQSYALFPHMTVLENVAFGLKRRGDKAAIAKANEALELVQLSAVPKKRPAARRSARACSIDSSTGQTLNSSASTRRRKASSRGVASTSFRSTGTSSSSRFRRTGHNRRGASRSRITTTCI